MNAQRAIKGFKVVRRGLQIGLYLVAALIVLAALLLSGLLIRLYAAPIDLAPFLPTLESMLSAPERDQQFEIGSIVVSWAGPGTPLDLKAENLRVLKDGDLVAGAPTLEVSLFLIDLLRGQVRISSGIIEQPRMLIVRGADGAFFLGIGLDQHAPDHPVQPQGPSETDWFQLLDGTPEDTGPFSTLDSFRIEDAELTIHDYYLDEVWQARHADFRFLRANEQLTGDARMMFDLGRAPMQLSADFSFLSHRRTGTVNVQFKDVQAVTLARRIDPALLPPDLQLDLPLTGAAQARFAGSAIPIAVTARLDSSAGALTFPSARTTPLEIDELRLAFEARPHDRTVRVDELTLALADPHLTINGQADVAGSDAGASGSVSLNLTHDDETIRLIGRLRPGPGDDGDAQTWSVFDGLIEDARIDRFAELVPALSPLQTLGMPITVGGALALSEDLQPRSALVDIQAEAGLIRLPTPRPVGTPSDLALDGFHAVATYDWATTQLRVPTLGLSLTSPRFDLALSGEAVLADGNRTATADLVLNPGSKPAELRFRLDQQRTDSAGRQAPYRLQIGLDALQPSRFAHLAAALKPLEHAAVPISGTVTLDTAADFSPERATFDLTTGAGRFHVPGFLAGPVGAKTLTVAGEVAWPLLPAPALLRIGRLYADFDGPRLEGSGEARRVPAGIDVAGEFRAFDVSMDRLPPLWPIDTAAGARAWVLDHVQEGFVPEAWIKGAGIANINDPGDILARFAEGGFDVEAVTVRYFGDLPPVTGISGRGRATEKTTLAIQTTGGRVEDVTLGAGQILITKLNEEDQDMTVTVPVQGPVRTTLAILDKPPLGYAQKIEIAPEQVSGRHVSALTMSLPLIADVDFEDVRLTVESQLRDAGIRDVAADFDLSQAQLTMQVSNDAVTVKGRGRIDDVPSRIDFLQNLTDDEAVRTRVLLAATVPMQQLARYGARMAPQVTGNMDADVSILQHRTEGLSVSTTLDLSKTVVNLPALGFRKETGEPGHVHFTLGFEDRIPTAITNLRVSAGNLLAQGLMKLDPTGTGWPERVLLTDLNLGRTHLRGDARRTGHRAYAIQLFGDRLDAQATLAYLKSRAEDGGPRPDQSVRPWPKLDVQGQVQRLLLGPGLRYVDQALFTLHHDGMRWDAFTLNGRMSNSLGKLRITYKPDGDRQKVTAHTDDAGTFLQVFGVTETVRHGELALIGDFDHTQAGQPMHGRFAMKDFKVVGVPLLARLLNALSITGLLELLTSEGLNFRRLHSSYAVDGDILAIENLRAAGSALGLTMDGRINLANTRIAAQGTVVPAYSVNRVLGLIPFLGDLLSGGEGQGLFAATYRVTRTLGEPDIAVNPLSILAPGFLRNLFFIDEDAEEEDLYDLVPPAQ